MALNTEAQRKVLEALKLPKERIDEILADGEHDIELPAVQIFDETGIAELKTNIQKGYQKDYPEIWCRTMNDEYELGLTGKDAKDQKKVLEALKAKAVKEAGITPAEWEGKFKTLQDTITAKEQEGLTWKQKYEEAQTNDKYRGLFWADRNDALDDAEWIDRLKRTYEIAKDGDIEGLKDKATGKFITDDKLNVLPYKDAFAIELAKDSRKSWHKVKTEPATPAPRPSHDPKSKNPALQQTKKYKSNDEILAAVEKKYPSDKPIPNLKKLRQDYYNQLSRELAA